MHTDLKVGMYWGDMGVDYWDGATWKQETEKHEVMVFSFLSRLKVALNMKRIYYF